MRSASHRLVYIASIGGALAKIVTRRHGDGTYSNSERSRVGARTERAPETGIARVADSVLPARAQEPPGGERIRTTVLLAWCDLQPVVQRVGNEDWLRRELATLNDKDDNDEEEED